MEPEGRSRERDVRACTAVDPSDIAAPVSANRGFTKGRLPAMTSSSVRFLSNGQPDTRRKSTVEALRVLAGAGTGAITKTAIAPLERVKILFQIQGMSLQPGQQPHYRGIVGTMVQVIKEESLTALYKGNGANVLRIVPTYALKFTFNDVFRDLVLKPGESYRDLSFPRLVLAGCMAGMFQLSATYPLELIRTRLALSAGLAGGVQYNGIIHCAREVVRTEGFRGLYKGLSPTLVSGIPYVGLQMSLYEMGQRVWSDHSYEGRVGVVGKLVCGAGAGLIAQSVTYPGDTLKRRMQSDGMGGRPSLYRGPWGAVRTIMAREGLRGFYAGLGVNALRALPGAAIQFACYDALKKLFDLPA